MRYRLNGRSFLLLGTALVFTFGWRAEAQTQEQVQEPMSLEQCRDLALEHNKQIQMAQADAVASDYLVQSAKTKYLPRVDFAGTQGSIQEIEPCVPLRSTLTYQA